MANARGIRAGRAYIEIGVNDQVTTALKRIQGQFQSFGASVASAGRTLALLGGAAVAPFGASVKAASDAEESMSRFRQVFGDLAGAATEFADAMAKGVGRSSLDIKDSLGTFQSFFVGLGFARDRALDLSQQMQTLAIDFASFNNLSDAEAQQRFISALSGSSEVLDRFGINIKQAALQQELLSMGTKKAWTEVTEQEKAVARLNIIMRSMGDQGAMGDAVRTADSFANQVKRLAGQVKDTAVAVGQALIPAAAEIVKRINAVAGEFAEWAKHNAQTIVDVAKLAAGVLAAGVALATLGTTLKLVSVAIGIFTTATTLSTAAIKAFTAALARNPLTAIAVVITAVAVPALLWLIDHVVSATDEIKSLGAAADDTKESLKGMLEGADSAVLLNRLIAVQKVQREIARLDKQIASEASARPTGRSAIAMIRGKTSAELEREQVLAAFRSRFATDLSPAEEAKRIAEMVNAADRRGASSGGNPPSKSEALRDARRRIEDLRVAAIKDEERRAIEGINARYDREREAAKDNGALIDQIETARRMELEQTAADFAQRRADEEARLAHDLSVLRAGLIEDEHQRALRLIDLRYREAIEAAQREGDARKLALVKAARETERAVLQAAKDRADQQKIIDEANRLTLQNAEQQAKLWAGAIEGANVRVNAIGTFSGALAGQLAGGDNKEILSTLKDIREATRENARELERIRRGEGV